jgi:ribosomal protein S18 acetylase RimI-like enzyme
MDDVLAGYRATGVFAAERWLLVEHGARDVGCLLLTDHPHTEQWELMYMGLIPAARGHGWGPRIVQHAQRLAAAARRHALSLAVDINNLPALRVYRQNGFCMLDQRRAMLYEMTGQRHSSNSLGH